MRRFPRLTRSFKWAGLLLSLSIAGAWSWSYVDSSIHDLGSTPIGYGTDGVELLLRHVQCFDGECHFGWDFDPPGSMTLFSNPIKWSWLEVDKWSLRCEFSWWVPFLITVIPTALLWWRDRRRIPPNGCRTCGYDLTGNVSGTCPECGQPVRESHLPAASQQKTSNPVDRTTADQQTAPLRFK